MRKLTKKEKLEAYTFAMFWELYELEEENYPRLGVCESLATWVNKSYNNIGFPLNYSINSFKEFARLQPKGKSIYGFWWNPGSPERLEAIEKAIELTEQL